MNEDINNKIESALKLQQQGQVDEAMAIFKSILASNPNQVDALHGLGLCYAQKHQYPEAIRYFKEAVNISPEIAPFHNNLANAYKAVGKIDDALRHYQEALRLKSNYPQALNNLGALLFRIGKYNEALNHFQKAIRMDPQSIDTHYNLGNTLVQLDQLSVAQTHFEKVLEKRPDHLGATHNLALTYTTLKNFDRALPLLEACIQREPENVDILFHLGVVYTAIHNPNKAMEYYNKLLVLYPNYAQAHHNLATLYLQSHENEKSLSHYQQALRIDPENETAKHMIAALSGHVTPSAPKAYVQSLFDQYAYSYDQHVKNTLKYQVPTLLRQAVTPYVHQTENLLTGLDLGCGTGLCAPLFADIVGKLTGVDLSANMLEVARLQAGYYQLHCDDIIHFLENQKSTYDLMIAADLLVYFGDLKTLFELVHQKLVENGLFCFNVEKNVENNSYVLHNTGRYAHSPSYLHQVCADRFEILSETENVLRYQEANPVMGILLVVRKIQS